MLHNKTQLDNDAELLPVSLNSGSGNYQKTLGGHYTSLNEIARYCEDATAEIAEAVDGRLENQNGQPVIKVVDHALACPIIAYYVATGDRRRNTVYNLKI